MNGHSRCPTPSAGAQDHDPTHHGTVLPPPPPPISDGPAGNTHKAQKPTSLWRQMSTRESLVKTTRTFTHLGNSSHVLYNLLAKHNKNIGRPPGVQVESLVWEPRSRKPRSALLTKAIHADAPLNSSPHTHTHTQKPTCMNIWKTESLKLI